MKKGINKFLKIRYISPICQTPPWTICTAVYVITCTKFFGDRSRGVDSVGVENCRLPLTKQVAVNKGLALPRSPWFLAAPSCSSESHAWRWRTSLKSQTRRLGRYGWQTASCVQCEAELWPRQLLNRSAGRRTGRQNRALDMAVVMLGKWTFARCTFRETAKGWALLKSACSPPLELAFLLWVSEWWLLFSTDLAQLLLPQTGWTAKQEAQQIPTRQIKRS